ncbi:MAG: hypothetical protein AAF639_20585 [Chloroflexota bacterium]
MTDKIPEQPNPNNQISVGDIDKSTVAIGDRINQNITHIHQYIDRQDARNQRNHAILRQAVNRFWVDGVLKSSLYQEVRIRLKLDENGDAVDNRPWDLILQQPNQPDQSIDEQMQLIDVYNQMGQRLLIMGEPGSGKTTTLLMLTESLLARAAADPTHPTPVVFNLSSWQSGQPLAEWLIEELNQRYQMPKKVSTGWIENDELIPLLDGLDEVDPARRDECVDAINAYRREHVVSMVVCSRTAEYASLTGKLQLSGAVVVRPLTQAQIDGYITDLGPQGETLAQMLDGDSELHEASELRDLARTPLMLSVMTLALQGDDGLSNNADRSPTQRLFDRYIRRMFWHRGLEHRYTPDDTMHWLQWMASQMAGRGQTIFFIERLQPDWLCKRSHVNVYKLIVGLTVGLIVGLIIMINLMLPVLLAFDLNVALTAWLSVGAFNFTLVGGLLAGLLTGIREKINVHEELNFSIKHGLIGGLSVSLITGLFILSFTLIEEQGIWLGDALRLAVGNGLLLGLIATIIFGINDLKSEQEIESFRQDVNKLPWKAGLSLILSFEMVLKSRIAEAKVKTKPNQGIWKSLRNGLVVALIFCLIFGFMGGLIFNFTFVLIIGLIGGITGGLVIGLLTCLQHFTLRVLLRSHNLTPWNYAHFLDYAAERLFLRKVGGGYVFIHRMVLEHIAALTKEDIERIMAKSDRHIDPEDTLDYLRANTS